MNGMRKSILLAGKVLVLTVVLAGINSCSLEKRMIEQEEELMRAFIRNNDVTVEPTESGLYYIETLAGTGPAPADGDTVRLYFKVYFLTGVQFGERITGDPFEVVIGKNQVIVGFEEGVKLMKSGGKARLIIPSKLAYGPRGDNYMIPGYTPLAYDLEMVSLIPGPGKK
jgi:FKBP-type peptidyl-prolyl cis-trans isomerase FkpA